MPKKNKKPRKTTRRAGRGSVGLPRTAVAVAPAVGSESSAELESFADTVARCVGTVGDADWRRLRDQALAQQPRCPDCGADWDLEAALEEEHVVAGEGHLISLSAPCSQFDADEAAGREPRRHPRSEGLLRHELNLT